MKCQNLFSGNNKKNVSIYCLLKILPRVLSTKKQILPSLKYPGQSFAHSASVSKLLSLPLQPPYQNLVHKEPL